MRVLIMTMMVMLSVSTAQAFSIATYNIRNFDYDDREHVHTDKQELGKILKETDADIIAVEEIVEKIKFMKFIDSYNRVEHKRYAVRLSKCGGGGRQHLGFVFDTTKIRIVKNSANQEIINEHPELSLTSNNSGYECYQNSRPGFAVLFEELATKKTFLAMAVHLKSGGYDSSIRKRQFQFKTLTKILKKYRVSYRINNFVILGDFNTTEYSKGPNNRNYHIFRNMVRANHLEDATEKIGCSSYWYGGRNDGIEVPSHLDHLLISPELKSRGVRSLPNTRVLTHCERFRCHEAPKSKMGRSYNRVSDHCPVVTEL